LVVSTATFAGCALLVRAYDARTPLPMLFLAQWVFAAFNQAFVGGVYVPGFRALDFVGATAIAAETANVASRSGVRPSTLAVVCVVTAWVGVWQMRAPSKEAYISRVNLWHAYCLAVFAGLYILRLSPERLSGLGLVPISSGFGVSPSPT